MSKKNLLRKPTFHLPRLLALKEELIAVTLTVVATIASEERNVGTPIARAGVDLDPSLDLTPLLIATATTVIVIGVTIIAKVGTTADATETVRVATATTIGATTAAPPRHLTSADHLTEMIGIDLMMNVAHLVDRKTELQSLLSM